MNYQNTKKDRAWICSCKRKNDPNELTCRFCQQPRVEKEPKKKAKRNIPQAKSLPDLKKKLTEVFNRFIRYRDTMPNGITFRCISSGKILPLDQMQAGHYHPAGQNESIRWDERNVNGQSIHDNYHLHGNFRGYTQGMIKKYGQSVVDELEIKRHNKSKMSKFEVSLLIDIYTKKCAEFNKNR